MTYFTGCDVMIGPIQELYRCCYRMPGDVDSVKSGPDLHLNQRVPMVESRGKKREHALYVWEFLSQDIKGSGLSN